MTHQAFICYSQPDRAIADTVCQRMEAAGVRCWIAPRDIAYGMPWDDAVAAAVTEARLLVVIFSNSANVSRNVLDEVGAALEAGAIVIPFRIEDVRPTGALGLRLRRVQWLDALTAPLEAHIDVLIDSAKRNLPTLEIDGRNDDKLSEAVYQVSVSKIAADVSRVDSRYRFRVRVEADNESNRLLGWSGLTINIPAINSLHLYQATEIVATSIGCDPPFRRRPGDTIFGFLDDGSFGEKAAASLLIEAVREVWPAQNPIALELVLHTSVSRLDFHVRVWGTRPGSKSGDGFGDPDWAGTGVKGQQGIPAYCLSIGFD